jgi:RHS repeat-associated protein
MATTLAHVPRRFAFVLTLVVASTVLVTGVIAEEAQAFPGRDDLRKDPPVNVTAVEAAGTVFVDPSADQIWRADAVSAVLPAPSTVVFNPVDGSRRAMSQDGARHTPPAHFPVSVTTASHGYGTATGATTPGPVRVSVMDAEATSAVGVNGLLFTVSGTGPVNVSVDYTRFTDLFGAGWGTRLRLVELPVCAVSAPRADRCLTPVPVESTNRVGLKQVSATLNLTTAGASALVGAGVADGGTTKVFALTAASGSQSAGDYAATDLSPTGSWSAGRNDGAFTYGYPLRLPPAAGAVPTVHLGYSSAMHDGRTSGMNNQASWLGDGWGYEPGYVERSYKPCSMDMDGGNNADQTGDLCWDGDGTSVTMSLNGANTTLVLDDESGDWHAEADNNWRIELLGSPASTSSGTTERWKVTTTDGTHYFFSSEPAMSSSRLTLPVFGNHSGEPCRSSEFAGSSCRQAYRWLLDKIVDVHGNLVRHYYTIETGHYGAAADPQNRVSYDRSSRLLRIDYGLRTDSSVAATGRVLFTAGDRCLSDCGSTADPTAQNWPDTPWDLDCEAAPCTSQLSPSFFSTKRLAAITTQVSDATGYRDVDTWTFEHEFKDFGDEDQAVLWLKSIQQTGHIGDDITLPKVQFGGEALPNRADAAAGVPMIWRWRLSSIKTETGAVITVNYSPPHCTPSNLPSDAHANSMRCYPVRWTPEFFTEPVEDWFHKYVVTSVVETDTTGGSVAVEIHYEYSTSGGGTSVLWAWDDSEFTEDEYRTYGQWRGYAQVTTRTGDPAEGQTTTRSRFYRGLDGQPLPTGTRNVDLTDDEGNTVPDHEALAGRIWESLTYNGADVISGSTARYWTTRTATRQRDHDGGDLEAWLSGVSEETTRTRLTATDWQRTERRTSYDAQGRAILVNDLGDTAKIGDEACTRTHYPENNTAWIKNAIERTEIVSVDCDTSPSRPADLTFDQLTYFDGSDTHGATPSKGLPTRIDLLDEWDTGPVYVTTDRTTYDALGRPTGTTDALGHATTTAYTPVGPGPLTQKMSTNPLGHRTTVHLEPAWGETTATVDPNGRRTDVTYDALARATAVWLPGRAKATQTPSMRFEYLLRDDAPSAVTTKTLNHLQQYASSVVLYDSLLRQRQTQTETADRGRLITEVVYDTQGRADEEFGPNHNLDPPGTNIVHVGEADSARRIGYFYDGAGRLQQEIFYNKHVERWRTTTTYGGSTDGFLVTVQPPHGAPATAIVTNAIGKTIEKRTYRSNSPTGAYDTLSYQYDRAGRLAGMTDQAGNQWSWEHDLRGNQVAAHDPDAGTTTRTYDDAGRLTSTADARGQTVLHGYDALGRQTSRRDGAGTLLAEWRYDTAINGIGMLGKSIRWVDGQAYVRENRAVNAMGLVTQTAVTIPALEGPLAGQHFFTKNYYPNGQVALEGLQGVGELERGTLSWNYDHVGNPTRLIHQGEFTGITVIVDQATFTPFNEVQTRRLGASDARHAFHGFVYEEGTRRLERATFDREASIHAVADLRYDYDDAGNLLSITDIPEDLPANHELQCFRYDYQRRLVEAWAQGEVTGCANTPSMGVLGGPAPYWNSYAHDVTGNRTSDTLRTPAETRTRTHTYPQPGEDQPHAVQQVTTTGTGEQHQFEYDQVGNTTSRNLDGQVQTLTWDTEGRLETVTQGGDTTRMVYDADGNRLIRDDGDTVTAYLPQTELTWNRTTGTVDGTRYFSHAGQIVAICTGRDVADWTFMGADQHGSTTTHAVNAFTGVEQVRRMDPYGNPRGTQPAAWPGQEGFVGGVHDPTGLVHIGARPYDPDIGRFVSVDPILSVENGQQINGYAYAHNNPVTFTDPTGLQTNLCLETCGSQADQWYQEMLRDEQQDTQRPPAPARRGEHNTPGFEPVFVGTVQFQVQDPEDQHTYYVVTATAYIWCNEDITSCDYHYFSRELYVEYIVQTIEKVTSGVIGPYEEGKNPNGSRLLVSDCTIYGRIIEQPNGQLVDDVGTALAAAGFALRTADMGESFAEGAAHALGTERGVIAKVGGGRFLPAAGFVIGVAGDLENGQSVNRALVTNGAAAGLSWAGAKAGMWASGFALPAAAGCGPLAPLCGVLIVGGFTIAGAVAGNSLGEYLGSRAADQAGW